MSSHKSEPPSSVLISSFNFSKERTQAGKDMIKTATTTPFGHSTASESSVHFSTMSKAGTIKKHIEDSEEKSKEEAEKKRKGRFWKGKTPLMGRAAALDKKKALEELAEKNPFTRKGKSKAIINPFASSSKARSRKDYAKDYLERNKARMMTVEELAKTETEEEQQLRIRARWLLDQIFIWKQKMGTGEYDDGVVTHHVQMYEREYYGIEYRFRPM